MTDELDVSDLERHMGVPIMPGELREPVAVNDIRRWVQAMHYPNPLHYDEDWAADSRFGRIIAPHSFTVATDTSHGCSPAQVGRIPDSHLVFGGDEWWFFNARIEPGDKLLCHRMPYDYKVRDTTFAGPTCFQRGDTLYINQRGERVALQRSTAIRYKVRTAVEEKKQYDDKATEPTWSEDDLLKLDETKQKFITQIQQLGHDKRLLGSVQPGDEPAPTVIGPHSLASFATEWRAYPMTTWGAMRKGPSVVPSSVTRRTSPATRAIAISNGSIRNAPTAPTTARREGTSTPSGPVASACPGATGTAPRWAHGYSTSWPRGPVNGAASPMPTCAIGVRRSPETRASCPAW
jgi:hypothetical protein